jgi:hypothetical protein
MRTDGVLPDNAPPLGATIDTDLAEHGFSLLRAAMALRELDGPSELASKGFERAANAFEALIRNADPEAEDRGFRRTVAAAAYHLAGFSAVAYSLLNEVQDDLNAAPGETAIMLLPLQDVAMPLTWIVATRLEAKPTEPCAVRGTSMETPKKTWDFFLAHAGPDQEIAEALCQYLAADLAANAGSRSSWLSAQRYSITTFSPST